MQDKRLADSLGFALVRLFRLVNRASGRAAAKHGLSGEQGHVLLVLWLEGPLKVGELQRILMLSSGTLSTALDRMERAGLARRIPDPVDGRSSLVEAMPIAARERRAVEATLEAAERECFAALTAAERKELLRLLTKAGAALEPR